MFGYFWIDQLKVLGKDIIFSCKHSKILPFHLGQNTELDTYEENVLLLEG